MQLLCAAPRATAASLLACHGMDGVNLSCLVLLLNILNHIELAHAGFIFCSSLQRQEPDFPTPITALHLSAAVVKDRSLLKKDKNWAMSRMG